MDKFVPSKDEIKKMMEFDQLFTQSPCEDCGDLF